MQKKNPQNKNNKKQQEEANKTKNEGKNRPNKKLQKEQTGSKTLNGDLMLKTVHNHSIMEMAVKKAKVRPAVRKSHPVKTERQNDLFSVMLHAR